MKTTTIPDATKAGLHPIVAAAERHVHHFLRRWPVSHDEARDMVRVEITRDVRNDLRAHFTSLHLFSDPALVSPIKIMGISYYVVDALPEPGWRVLP